MKLFSAAVLCVAYFTLAPIAGAQELDAPLNVISGSSNTGFEALPTSAKAKAGRVRSAGFRTRAGKNKKNNSSPFQGSWYTTLVKKQNTCPGNLPGSLKVGLKIDPKLKATDLFDGSPFFTGRILASNRIGFARSRVVNGCTQTQVYVLGDVSGSKGFSVLQSDTKCGSNSCRTVYSGSSIKK